MSLTGLHVGVDLGTSGCRGCAVDPAGRVVARAGFPLPPSVRLGPRVEQDPEDWWEAVARVLRALAGSGQGRIRTVAVAGTSGTLLLADETGAPRGPALMYDDGRAAEAARRIARVAPPDCGAHGAGSSLAKLLWALEREPGVRALRPLHPADWITGRLTGRFDRTDENNALKLGYDPIRRDWPAWLSRLGVLLDRLPRASEPGTRLSPIDAGVAEALDLPGDVTIVAGTTDGVAGFLATGAARAGEAVSVLGSTLVLKVAALRPVFAPDLGVYSHRVGSLWLAGGASNSGGAVLRHFFDDERIRAMTPRVSPGQPTGLAYYPLLAPGERFPIADPALEPRLEPRPTDDLRFFQGLLEGIASIERLGYRRLAELGAPYPSSVRTVGGGAGNEPWTEIRRARLGVPLLPAEDTEAARGVARLGIPGNG